MLPFLLAGMLLGVPQPQQTQDQTQEPALSTLHTATKKPALDLPPILLKETRTLRTAAFLERDASLLLHADVHVPRRLKSPVRLPEGRYTAEELLHLIADQLCAGEQQQGVWHRGFVFTSATTTAHAVSLLPSAGNITLEQRNFAFATLVRTAAKAVGCTVELPFLISGRYDLQANNEPIERSLETLASRIGLSVRDTFRFDFDTDTKITETPTSQSQFIFALTGDQTPVLIDFSSILGGSELWDGNEPLDLSAPSDDMDPLTPVQLAEYSTQALSGHP